MEQQALLFGTMTPLDYFNELVSEGLVSPDQLAQVLALHWDRPTLDQLACDLLRGRYDDGFLPEPIDPSDNPEEAFLAEEERVAVARQQIGLVVNNGPPIELIAKIRRRRSKS